jgi:hypothetical protein
VDYVTPSLVASTGVAIKVCKVCKVWSLKSSARSLYMGDLSFAWQELRLPSSARWRLPVPAQHLACLTKFCAQLVLPFLLAPLERAR